MILRISFAAAAALVIAATPVAAEDPSPPPEGAMPAPNSPVPPAANDAVGVLPPERSGEDVKTRQSLRFQFSRIGDSLLRLDGETGQVALCGPHSVGWGCQAVPEDRAALDAEISRLHTEIELLKRNIAGLQKTTPAPVSPPESTSTPPAATGDDIKLSAADDLQRVRIFVENAWHKFVEKIVQLRKDIMRKG